MATNWTYNQQLAIDTIGQNMQIVACAGSGKTSTMVAHILRLLEEEEINPENIVAITYTEKAAASLKQKVYDEYKKAHDSLEGLANMYIGTIHGFCLHMLQEFTDEYKSFETLNDVQTRLFIKRTRKTNGLFDVRYHMANGKVVSLASDWSTAEQVAKAINAYKAFLDIGREHGTEKLNNHLQSHIQKYEAELKRKKYFDFTSIVRVALQKLKEGAFDAFIENGIKYLIVDEYQDVNASQEEIIQYFAHKGTCVCVVGDDDQTIYQWRGSNLNYIKDFVSRYDNVKKVDLDLNFRSSRGITEISKQVISQNNDRLDKNMQSNNSQQYEPGDIITYEFDDIIYKAFEQAYNATYHPEKLVFPEVKYLLVKDINMLRQVAERVKKVERIAYDLETNSITYTKAKILSIGISWAKNTAVAWPLWVKDEDACSKMLEGLESREKTKMATQIDHNPPLKKFWKDDEWDEVIKLTKEIFENTPCKKGGHNTFFDNLVLHYNGIEVNNYTYDTMVMKHLLDEEREKSLDYCSWIYTDKGGYKMAKEVYLKSSESNYANIPLDVLLNYNAGDAAVTYELYDIFKPRIISENLTYEMGAIRMPLQRALMEACIYGMRVDRKYLRETNKKLTQEMAEIEAKMLPTLQKYYGKDVNIVSGKDEGKMTGNDFNINSSDCLKDLLFNKMKLKSSGTTESGAPSTNESALLKLSRKGVEIADLILQRKKKS